MLIVLIRAVVIFFILLIVIRLMGKRQIGEMEPFELAITLVIAELACIPMADKSIPLTYGIVAIFAMYLIHQLIMLVTKKNLKMQQIVSGKPTLVLDKDGIRAFQLKELDMRTTDLLQALRAAGHFSIDEVAYALFETNGTLSVIPFTQDETEKKTLPVPVILDGQWAQDDIENHNFNRAAIEKIMSENDLSLEKLLLVTLDEEGKILYQIEEQPYKVVHIAKEEIYNV